MRARRFSREKESFRFLVGRIRPRTGPRTRRRRAQREVFSQAGVPDGAEGRRTRTNSPPRIVLERDASARCDPLVHPFSLYCNAHQDTSLFPSWFPRRACILGSRKPRLFIISPETLRLRVTTMRSRTYF